MSNTFSLACSHCVDLTDPSLVAEIQAHTGSELATASILRSIDRFGTDPSIERFEVTPRQRGRVHPTANPVTWSVRALRASDSDPDSEEMGSP